MKDSAYDAWTRIYQGMIHGLPRTPEQDADIDMIERYFEAHDDHPIQIVKGTSQL